MARPNESIKLSDLTDEKLLDIGLEKYREWLNMWFANEEWAGQEMPELSLEEFHRYDSSHILNRYNHSDPEDAVFQQICIIFSADYGDDGGAAIMTAWFDWDRLTHLTQEFDTMFQTIWEEDKFLNTPEDKGYVPQGENGS